MVRVFAVFFLLLFQLPLHANAQAAGFGEELLPSLTKVNAHVKAIKIKTFNLKDISDTLANGIPDEIQTYNFDSAGRLLKVVYKEIGNKRYQGETITYQYFGKDSVIYSELDKGKCFHKVKTINTYSENKLVMQTFYTSQYPKYIEPELFLAAVSNYYDSNGFLIKQVHRGQPGQLGVTTIYKNDERGNHIMISPPSENRSIDEQQRNYTYDIHDNPSHSDEYTYSYVYDNKGNWIKLITRSNRYLNYGGGVSDIKTREITYY